MIDAVLFTSIFLFSTFFCYVSIFIRVKLLILKLQIKIKSLKNLVGLLDEKILIINQQIKYHILNEVNSNIVVASVIFLAVGVTIAILLFFFSGGGSGPNSDTSSIGDPFTPRGSEGSISKSSSNVDLRDIDSASSNVDISTNITNNSGHYISEDIVMQAPILEPLPLNTSLMETFDRMQTLLLPNVSEGLKSYNQQFLGSDSINVNLGTSIIPWLQTVSKLFRESLSQGFSTSQLQNLERTLDSMDQHLVPFILQTEDFLNSSKLNTVTKMDPNFKDQFQFVFNARDVANELLQKLVEHEAVLKEMLPGTLIVPECFPEILGFLSMMTIISSEEIVSLHRILPSTWGCLKNTIPLEISDLPYQESLRERVRVLYSWLEYFLKSKDDNGLNSTGEFLRVIDEETDTKKIGIDVFFKLSKELYKHHKCLNIDPINIILFLG